MPLLFLASGIISGSFYGNAALNFAVVLITFTIGLIISSILVKIFKSLPKTRFKIINIIKEGDK